MYIKTAKVLKMLSIQASLIKLHMYHNVTAIKAQKERDTIFID